MGELSLDQIKTNAINQVIDRLSTTRGVTELSQQPLKELARHFLLSTLEVPTLLILTEREISEMVGDITKALLNSRNRQ